MSWLLKLPSILSQSPWLATSITDLIAWPARGRLLEREHDLTERRVGSDRKPDRTAPTSWLSWTLQPKFWKSFSAWARAASAAAMAA